MKTNIITTAPEVPSQQSRIIDIAYNTEGHITNIQKRTVNPPHILEGYEPFKTLTEARLGNRTIRLPLLEAVLSNPDSANILRQDLRLLAFNAYNNMERTFAAFTTFETSNKPQEEYLRDAALGVMSPAPSGTEAPRAKFGFEGGTTVVNTLYRLIVEILGDWIRFDQISKLRQVAPAMGLSGRMTEEHTVWKYIRDTANYTRNSTTNDNDAGANTQTLTWNADSLRLAKYIIMSAKDRKSGAYLGYNADTVICGPLLEVPVLQLLRSPALVRTHGANTAEAIGTGQDNPFQGMISRIIVSPWFDDSYAWALCDSRVMSFVFQTVENFNIFQQTPNITSEAWLHYDVIEYLIRGYFGIGFVDDRAWFLSDSTTDATVS